MVWRDAEQILRKEGLDPVVVHEQVGLSLDIFKECLVNQRIHVANNWDLNCLVLDLLLAATHGLDHLGTALVSTDTICDMVEVHGRGERAGSVILGAAPALFARVGSLAHLVTGLPVQEAVVATLTIYSSLTG